MVGGGGCGGGVRVRRHGNCNINQEKITAVGKGPWQLNTRSAYQGGLG